MLCDVDGFAIPFAADDAVIECGACDPEYGDPAEWPAWTDADIVWLNENPTLPPLSGGSPEPFVPTAADWADYEAFCREVDQRYEMERMERLEDECRLRFG